ncbi:DegT/DnrJ/EryC1/StrS family aminotransferase [Gammaproteobacteria bacterium]
MTTLPAILGGTPIRHVPFPQRRTMGSEERAAVLAVMDSDCLSGFIGAHGEGFLGGVQVRAFENAWAEQYGFRHAVSVNSLTSGLIAALGAVGVGPGDEVICSPFTMSASATCALFWGAVPVFADIDPVTFCLEPASVATRISPRTRAIVAVHLFGHPADMDGLLALAKPRGIAVVEDAAQAPGVFYHGQPVGAIGTCGGFSLNYHKHIHTGEGGMLVTHDDTVARRLQLIRNHGENLPDGWPQTDPGTTDAIGTMNRGGESCSFGGNYRLTELQAAIGIAQLKRLDGLLAHRQRIASHVTAQLAGRIGITPPVVAADCTHAWYVYPIRYESAVVGLSRALFVRAVNAELPVPRDFEATALVAGYVRPLYLNRLYQERRAFAHGHFPFDSVPTVNYTPGLCPVAERMYEHELLLCPLVREPLIPADLDDFVQAVDRVLTHVPLIQKRLGDG